MGRSSLRKVRTEVHGANFLHGRSSSAGKGEQKVACHKKRIFQSILFFGNQSIFIETSESYLQHLTISKINNETIRCTKPSKSKMREKIYFNNWHLFNNC